MMQVAQVCFFLLIAAACGAMAIGLHRGIFSAPTRAIDRVEFLFELVFATFAAAAFYAARVVGDFL